MERCEVVLESVLVVALERREDESDDKIVSLLGSSDDSLD